MNMKRCFASVLCSFAFAATALSASNVASANDDVSIGSVPQNVSSIIADFANASGAFKKYGIDAHLITIEGGSRGMQVLLSDKIQVMQAGLSVIVQSNREGTDLRMVSSNANSSLFDIYVTKDIKTPGDLKGKKFAISSFTAETDIAATLALQKWGMTRKDMNIVALGGAGQRLAAQVTNQVAASAYSNPSAEVAHQKGLVKMLDLSRDGMPWVFDGMVLQKDYIKAHPDTVKRLIQAYAEGEYKALSDEKWAKDVIGKSFKTDNQAIIDAAYNQWKATVPRDVSLTKDAVANVIDGVDAMGPKLKTKDQSAYVDTSFTDALHKDGFFDQVKNEFK
ncbi:ABC transporter substrate-binding protein [Paraburkholderia sp. ZP32-5]|uniref:ABC transporter substrate-binding protein n=1 Tax=Paraburkholderia sp. ZP32-5 TaxID=2883245 RepID=UPI001F38D228|nr:ABC transporter substrate-binding protein [Paraburkholderia sp. ZP32-5]